MVHIVIGQSPFLSTNKFWRCHMLWNVDNFSRPYLQYSLRIMNNKDNMSSILKLKQRSEFLFKKAGTVIETTEPVYTVTGDIPSSKSVQEKKTQQPKISQNNKIGCLKR